ncbi:HlyD family secretion protein [Shimia sp.]|uniref:HlyD family secretion protein n=1 Tax=Shimia sp. TaxID=1954381 RepID=UPI003B8BE0D3
MKIRHQHPSSDLSWTVQAPLTLETPTGEVVDIDAWSLAGLVWPEAAGDCPQTGILSVPFQGVDIRFPVRLSSNSSTGTADFEGLSGRQRETLAIFYRSLLSGKMASSEDVITSLDTPVDLVPMGETESEISQAGARVLPAPIRVILNVALYVGLAILVSTVLGTTLFNSFMRIDLEHGRVVAPIVDRLPAGEGFVKSISVLPGEAVKEGDILVRIKDPVAEARLTHSRAQLSVAEKELSDLLQAIGDLEDLHTVASPQTRAASVVQVYARFVGDRGFENMYVRWTDLLATDPVSALQNDPFVFALSRLKEVETAFRAKIRGLRAARDAQRGELNSSHVRAPSDGIVHEILVRKGQPYRPSDLAVVFEADTPRVVVGWVSQSYAQTIFVGMPASIGLNVGGSRRNLAGVVTDVTAGSDPRRPGEFGILVTVTSKTLSYEETREQLRRNAPVSLEVRKAIAQKFFDKVSAVF